MKIVQNSRDFSRPSVNNSFANDNNNSQNIVLSDNNAKKLFSKSASSEYVSFSSGKVMIKSFGVLDKIGYGFLAVGAYILFLILRGSDGGISLYLTGAIIILVGFLIVSFVKTFSVIDYRTKSIYSETQFKGKGIWKSNKTTAFSNIIEISVDNRPTEVTAQNMGMGLSSLLVNGNGAHKHVAKSDSAIAALLNNGTIFYITDFTSNADITNVYKVFSCELAKAINVSYKTNNNDDYQLVVKKRGTKFYFDSDNYKAFTGNYVKGIIIYIFLGILLIIGAMIYFHHMLNS